MNMKSIYISSWRRYNEQGSFSPCGWVELDDFETSEELKDLLSDRGMDPENYDEELCILDDDIYNDDLRYLLNISSSLIDCLSNWELLKNRSQYELRDLAATKEWLGQDDVSTIIEESENFIFYDSIDIAVDSEIEENIAWRFDNFDYNVIDRDYLKKKLLLNGYEASNGVFISQ